MNLSFKHKIKIKFIISCFITVHNAFGFVDSNNCISVTIQN